MNPDCMGCLWMIFQCLLYEDSVEVSLVFIPQMTVLLLNFGFLFDTVSHVTDHVFFLYGHRHVFFNPYFFFFFKPKRKTSLPHWKMRFHKCV